MAAGTLPRGIAVSFSNTPQASADLFTTAQIGLTEDNLLGVVLLDVMANDLGGNAKSLYSLDDGANSAGATGDLLTQDGVGVANASAHGATIKITADGRISYDASTLDASFAHQLQSLSDGEFATDSFTYAIRLGNGTLSWTTATVQIAGVNDVPVASAIAGDAREDSGNPVTLAASYTDPDAHDTHTVTVDTTGTTGAVVDNGDGTFNYDPNGKFETLSQDETATDTFSYTVTDSHGANSTATATMTIHGENDPVVAANIAADANEDSGNPVTLTASYTDVDAHDAHTFSVDTTGTKGAVVNTGNGTFSYNPNGKFESLAQGESATDTFSYTVSDNHGSSSTKTATVTIHGENDGPALQAAVGSPPVFGNDSLSLAATMAFSDIDLSDTHSVTFTALGDNYVGHFTATKATDSTGGIQGSVALSYHLTKDDVGPSGFPDHQDYRVTIDDHHGATSSQIISIPLAEILRDVDGGGGGGGGGGGNNHNPVIYINPAAHDAAGGTVFDDISHPNRQHVIGRLSFSDVETGQAHDVNAVGNTPGPLGTLGMLFASIERDTDGSLRVTGDPDGFLAASPSDGVLKWDYHVNEDRIQMLGQNESHTDFFDVMLTDHNGGFTTQKVAVLVQGANDVPVLQGDGEHSLYFDGSFTDAPNPLVTVGLQQVNGFGFIDPDQNDHHTVSAHLNLSKSTVDVAASLTVELIKDTHEFGPFDTNGQIRWIYQRDVNTTAYLPGHGGEPRIQTWDVTIDDGHGGAIIPFVVTFNSAPVIQNNAPTEMILDEIPSESIRDLHGILIFSDADPTDHHTVTVSSDSALMHGTQPVGTLTASLEPNFNITSNLVHWDYYVSEAAIEHLHAGEQLVDAFDVQVDDGHGGIAQHLVKVTILGNDFDLVWQT